MEGQGEYAAEMRDMLMPHNSPCVNYPYLTQDWLPFRMLSRASPIGDCATPPVKSGHGVTLPIRRKSLREQEVTGSNPGTST